MTRRLRALVDLPCAGHLRVRRFARRRRREREVALLDQPLHQVVQQLGEPLPLPLVALPLAPQLFEHLRRELPALDQRAQQRFLQRIQRPAGRVHVQRVRPPRLVLRPAREPALEQEVREPVQQLLDVQRVEQAAAVLGVSGEAHGRPSVGREAMLVL